MPHAEEPDLPDTGDSDYDTVMQQLTGISQGPAPSFDFLSRDLETGNKADDAVDYADFDFDDDDLPEEEVAVARPAPETHAAPLGTDDDTPFPEEPDKGLFEAEEDLFGDRQEERQEEHQEEPQQAQGDELDDLFGEGPSAPGPDQADPTRDLFFDDGNVPEPTKPPVVEPPPVTEPISQPLEMEEDVPEDEPTAEAEEDMDPATLRAWKLQQSLFAMSVHDTEHPPAPPENVEELLHSLFPSFNSRELPRFLELIPHKKAFFVGKQPVKPPKPVLPTKINLDLAQDQERSFKTGGQTYKRALEPDNLGFVPVIEEHGNEEEKTDFEQDDDAHEVLLGGITLQDLQVICADWDTQSDVSAMDIDEMPQSKPSPAPEAGDEDDWLFETTRPAKKRKTGRDPKDIVGLSHIDIPLFDDPEEMTSRVGRKVTMDMNDPHLLLDDRAPESAAPKTKALHALNRDEMDSNVTRRLHQRYNISNDDAYDMLKQNHQHKVRSTLGNASLEHAMPALRLQWPYYKTELNKAEARSFHRPALNFRPGQTSYFKNPAYIKRKHQRGKDAKEIFGSTESLSLGDNSHALLVEYSEEVPAMLSNFGMSNRFINYYRRKTAEDPTRPKAEIGETAVLLPQDKSPFSVFGHVDPGETAPAISNSMYRAPLYPQNAKPSDFLVARSTTGSGGSDYHIRNIENLFVAGQQFPSVDVPGPHSRKVTTVAKHRMRMLVYRLLKKSGDLKLSISDVTAHIPGTTDMQNRQKVKDFLTHDKDSKYWVPQDPIPESDAIRSWVQPEDVCLLESMQVGQQHLQDTGYGSDAENGGEEEMDEEGESFEQQMAPWKATRNFLLASQGKAMLKLHGEGDPTGRGEGYSFIKTSMKGGFKAVGESATEKIDAARAKETGGHSYNVARQQKAYETSIRRIWEAQKASLSSTVEHSEYESDMDEDDEEDFNKPTPRSEFTPAPGRRDDETTSQFSKISMSNQKGKVMRIVRMIKDPKTGERHQREQLVWDPRVIRLYMQHRHRLAAVTTKLDSLQPTGNEEIDARNRKLIEQELFRLNRNKERRFAREKQKGIVRPGAEGEAASPAPADGDGEGGTAGTTGAGTQAGTAGGPAGSSSSKPAGTQRRCANCGQVGHIKTNKKLCPMLNGTMQPEDTVGETAFAMGSTPAV